MMKFLVLLLASFLEVSIDAVSFPLLYCINEKATPGECSSEATQAVDATKDWFDAYMYEHGENNRRHLLDCSRFCDRNTASFFTIQYPCDCKNNRKLSSVEVVDINRSLQYDPLEGPIQIFRAFSNGLPDSYCKTLLRSSHCIITFVDTYNDSNNGKNMNEDNENSSESKAVDLDETYDPVTGDYQLFDIKTGDLIENDDDEGINVHKKDPKADTFTEVYNPVTGQYTKVDPDTGVIIGDDTSINNGKGTSTDIIFEETYDPATGTYHKIDPNTGLPIDEP